MKIKGFTLIELLAVIVILAIIALIATPIILNIINSSKIETTKRSAENYVKAVEQAILRKNLTGECNPNTCEIQDDKTLFCDGLQLDVEIDGEYPARGTIVFENGMVKTYTGLLFSGQLVTKSSDGTVTVSSVTDVEPVLSTICTVETQLVTDTYTIGDKYTCTVSPQRNYTFYILSEDGNKVNLIMDSNVDSLGNPIKDIDPMEKGLVEWQTSSNNADGPTTAMDYLKTATTSWTNLDDIMLTGWNSDESIDNVGTFITPYQVKARLPYYQELNSYSGPEIYDYLQKDDLSVVATHGVSGVYGYWTLSASATAFDCAGYVDFGGSIGNNIVDNDYNIGVRPVITVLKSQLG